MTTKQPGEFGMHTRATIALTMLSLCSIASMNCADAETHAAANTADDHREFLPAVAQCLNQLAQSRVHQAHGCTATATRGSEATGEVLQLASKPVPLMILGVFIGC